MKKFIIKFGRVLLDISAYIVLSIILVGIGISCFFPMSFDGETSGWNFFIPVLIAIFAFIAFVCTYFFLYLFIDINDNLTEINEKLVHITKENVHEQTEVNEISEKSCNDRSNFLNKNIYKR